MSRGLAVVLLLATLGGVVPALAQPSESPALAAPGYVDDAICSSCHASIAESYQSVGMSRAFYRPTQETVIESYSEEPFFHAPSNRYYRMFWRGEELFLERYRKGPGGAKRDVLEEQVHWILGSGSNARSYIHQTPWGELFQLPLSWYTRSEKWGMAPGYDIEEHQGFTRRVQRDCMFCHNSYPEVSAASDDPEAPQIFPKDLPHGLGCQRCHGPGALHVQLSFDLEAGEDQIRDAIYNSARESPERRDEVCLQCHLQPTVTLSGVRHFGRDMYSYEAGESVDDYLVYMDVIEERPKKERFEINHHPYRLAQSPCFLESPAGALTCLTCHDPHNKPQGEAAKVQFRDACLSCHQLEDCDLEAMSAESTLETDGERPAVDDCVACHMPRRRTQDVIEVALTDHLIVRRPESAEERLGPLPEQEHRIRTVEFLRPGSAPEGPIAEVYRQLAMVRAGSRAALDRLRTALATASPEHVSPWVELAVGELGAGRFPEAEKTLRHVIERDAEHLPARVHLGVALAAQGKVAEAIQHLGWAFERAPERPEVRFNLGKLLVQLGRPVAALSHFQAAVTSRPLFPAGWLELGNTHARTGQFAEAAIAYRRALAVEPDQPLARQNLVEALLRQGLAEEALEEARSWVHFEPGDEKARGVLERVQGGVPETGD